MGLLYNLGIWLDQGLNCLVKLSDGGAAQGVWSESLIREFFRNPWQIFEPQTVLYLAIPFVDPTNPPQLLTPDCRPVERHLDAFEWERPVRHD